MDETVLLEAKAHSLGFRSKPIGPIGYLFGGCLLSSQKASAGHWPLGVLSRKCLPTSPENPSAKEHFGKFFMKYWADRIHFLGTNEPTNQPCPAFQRVWVFYGNKNLRNYMYDDKGSLFLGKLSQIRVFNVQSNNFFKQVVFAFLLLWKHHTGAFFAIDLVFHFVLMLCCPR